MSEELRYEVADQIATITFNRPERMNALTHELEAELHRRFDEADADHSVRVIILTGAGRAFCSGYDQGAVGKSGTRHSDPTGKSHAEYIRFWERTDGLRVAYWTHMWGLAKPIIAAVNGWAMGGGFWYQLAADITIASEEAVFAQPEVRHISNSTFLFGALCGWKAANRWALTGDHFDAQEALRLGMVNEVVPAAALMDAARGLAKRSARTGSRPTSTCATGRSSRSRWVRAPPRDGRSRCRDPIVTRGAATGPAPPRRFRSPCSKRLTSAVADGLDFAAMPINPGGRFHEHLHDWPRGDIPRGFFLLEAPALHHCTDATHQGAATTPLRSLHTAIPPAICESPARRSVAKRAHRASQRGRE